MCDGEYYAQCLDLSDEDESVCRGKSIALLEYSGKLGYIFSPFSCTDSPIQQLTIPYLVLTSVN